MILYGREVAEVTWSKIWWVSGMFLDHNKFFCQKLWQKALCMRAHCHGAGMSSKFPSESTILSLYWDSVLLQLFWQSWSFHTRVLNLSLFSSNLDVTGCPGQLPNSSSPLHTCSLTWSFLHTLDCDWFFPGLNKSFILILVLNIYHPSL
jgi:hypothetical protein